MKAKKLFFKECNLAGRKYHDVDEVWEELKVGTKLRLERDLDNRHDDHAVAVMYDRHTDDDTEEFLLGYIPQSENEIISQLLGMGWTNIFETRISKLTPDAHYENQIRLTIRIVNKNVESKPSSITEAALKTLECSRDLLRKIRSEQCNSKEEEFCFTVQGLTPYLNLHRLAEYLSIEDEERLTDRINGEQSDGTKVHFTPNDYTKLSALFRHLSEEFINAADEAKTLAGGE